MRTTALAFRRNINQSSAGGSSGGGGGASYVRVIDVIMDSSHPKYKDLGGSQSIYGVFYEQMYCGNELCDSQAIRNFAYCNHQTFRRIPIKNEIVTLVSGFRADTTDEYGNIGSTERCYWDEIIPVWNSTHLNVFPDQSRDGNGPADTGKNFKELDNIRPLKLNDGDVSIEGRFGNTIRFGGTKGKGGPVSDDSSNGKPYILIRAGQTDKDEDCINENIDKDGTSIYLLTDHKADLTQANDKRKAWKDKKGPVKAKDFRGTQLLVNSNRIFFNARENDIELSAKKEIGLNAKVVGIDGEDYVALDANKIYLGTSAFLELNPVLLGTETTNWLSRLCMTLTTLLNTMSVTTSPFQLPALAAAANVALVQIKQLGLDPTLKQLHSKKSFVE